MSTPKVNNKREPEAAGQPALRLYQLASTYCPKRFVEAYSIEEAKRWYREMFHLHAGRNVEAMEVVS